MLEVPPTAGDDEIRASYRRLARLRHPDRNGGDERAMASLNEAYRVLGDPARRVEYDRQLRGSAAPTTHSFSTPPPSTTTVRVPLDTSPARYPWKLVAAMGTVGALVVLVGAALYEPGGPPPPDQILQPGSCVAVVALDRSASEIACDDTARYQVQAIVAAGERCPTGSDPYRDRLRGDTACVVPFDPDA